MSGKPVKKLVSRALDWHVREQVEFNRNVMRCVEETLEALNETRRAIAALVPRFEPLQQEAAALRREAAELQDIRSHWEEWRVGWEMCAVPVRNLMSTNFANTQLLQSR